MKMWENEGCREGKMKTDTDNEKNQQLRADWFLYGAAPALGRKGR